VKVSQPLRQFAWNWSGFYIGTGGSIADLNAREVTYRSVAVGSID